MLQHVYPGQNWKPERWAPTTLIKKNQRHLVHVVRELYPDLEVFEDYRHSSLRFESSGYSMELDVFVPALNLAFEYQGQHHFADHYLFGSHRDVVARDLEKASRCAAANIVLIPIPYWWNKSAGSVAAEIAAVDQSLLPEWAEIGERIGEFEPVAPSTSPALVGNARVTSIMSGSRLLCTLPGGAEFECQSTLSENVTVGSLISYRFSGVYVDGLPQRARLTKVLSLPERSHNPLAWYLCRGKLIFSNSVYSSIRQISRETAKLPRLPSSFCVP